MSVNVFFDPHRVEQLRRKGINPQRLRGINTQRQLASGPSEARTALELVEECGRLRADNRRLSDEVARLTAEIARLQREAVRRPDAPQREEIALDDAAQRFALLELDL